MTAAKLLLVRHGATAWNVTGRLQGRADVPIDIGGRVQMRRVAPVLQARAPQLLYSSPLRRALESARELARPLGLEIRILHDLAEIDYGGWQGRDEAECQRDWPVEWRRWRIRPWRVHCPGGEGGAAFAQRVAAVGNRIAEEAAGRVAVVVTHGHVVRLFSILSGAIPAGAFWRLGVPNASLHALDLRGPRPLDPRNFARAWRPLRGISPDTTTPVAIRRIVQ